MNRVRRSGGKSPEIALGDRWMQFAFPRDDLEYLGTIRRGLEIGALARDRDGNFLLVNGDVQQTLNRSKIESLLRSTRPSTPPFKMPTVPTRESMAAVKIVVKARRKFVMPA